MKKFPPKLNLKWLTNFNFKSQLKVLLNNEQFSEKIIERGP